MTKTKLFIMAFAMSLMFGSFTLNARCTGCTGGEIKDDFDGPITTYSATVRNRLWHFDENGNYVSYWSYYTVTGSTMAYCQQQLQSVLATPGTQVVQGCQADD